MNNDTSKIFNAYAKHLVTEAWQDPVGTIAPSAEKKEETNTANPEERNEVKIGQQIVSAIKSGHPDLKQIMQLAYQLIQMHRGPEEACEGQSGVVGGVHKKENEESAEQKVPVKFLKNEKQFKVPIKHIPGLKEGKLLTTKLGLKKEKKAEDCEM